MSTPPSALERYLSHLRTGRRLAANTLSAYSRDGNLLMALAGERAVEGLGPQDIRRFIATLHSKGQSPRSLARILSSWRGLFDWMARHPDRWTVFDDAMAAGGRMHALTLDAALDWSATRRVCDVGGGTGHLLASLLELQPHLEGALFDLPDVVGRAVRHERLTAIGGDAFREVPNGFDTYLLVNVLHDWNDDDAGKILGCVAQAAPGDARIIVVDNERTVTPRNDFAVSADVLMAALTNGGRERSTSEFAALGRHCGLRIARTLRLASGDVAHEFVTSRQ